MGYISIGAEKLHYLKAGTGRQLLLAFHGYGNDAHIFHPLNHYLCDIFTILSFDLPFHGKSHWTEGRHLTKQDLVTLVDTLKKEYDVDKVSLLGYSLGGSVCLTITECIPDSVHNVALLGTDGLRVNKYYYFLTRTLVGRFLFRHMLHHSAPYFVLLNLIAALKLINPARHRFVLHSLQTPEKRDHLIRVWQSTSDLIPNPETTRSAIRRHNINMTIFMGIHDKIIPPSLAEKFRLGLDTVKLFILERGHKILDNENAEQIAAALL